MKLGKALAALSAFVSVQVACALDFTGHDWFFNYSGHYNVTDYSQANLGLVQSVLGTVFDLTGQLNLIGGTTSASGRPATILQTTAFNFGASGLGMSATNGQGLVPSLALFVDSLLSQSNGAYQGAVSGTLVTLTRASHGSIDLNGLVDTRIAGTGVVLDLRGNLTDSVLYGTAVSADGANGQFRGQVMIIRGATGDLDTIDLVARARVFALGIVTVDTGYVRLGTLDNHADSWGMVRFDLR